MALGETKLSILRRRDGRRSSYARSCLLAAALAAGVLTAGCGGGDDEPKAAATSTVSQAEVAGATGQVRVAGWSEYKLQKVQDSDGVTAKWSYLAADEDVPRKALSGDFDLVMSSNLTVQTLDATGKAKPIDTSLIPNYASLPEQLRDAKQFQNSEGQTIAVPFVVVPLVTAWDSSAVPEPRTLDDLLTSEYKGRIALADSATNIQLVARGQGADSSGPLTREQLDNAMKYLEELRPNIKTIVGHGEVTQLLNRDDIDVAFGTYPAVIDDAAEGNPKVRFNFLGALSVFDSLSIVGPANEAASLKWINGMLSEPVQKAVVKATGAPPVNAAAQSAYAALDSASSKELSKLSLDELLEKSPPATGFAVKSEGDVVGLDEVVRTWNEYKASF